MAKESRSRTYQTPLAAPPGFEVRPPHQGRFSSTVAGDELLSSPLHGARSSRLPGQFNTKPRQLQQERLFIVERAHVQDKRVVGNASDHRDG